MEQGEEKYLSLRLNMPTLVPEDFEVLIKFPTLHEVVKIFSDDPEGVGKDEVDCAIKALKYVAGKGEVSAVPTIRVLEGRLLELFEEFNGVVPAALINHKKESFALLCAFAWFSSSKLVERRGW
jgi:hypothetical protein